MKIGVTILGLMLMSSSVFAQASPYSGYSCGVAVGIATNELKNSPEALVVMLTLSSALVTYSESILASRLETDSDKSYALFVRSESALKDINKAFEKIKVIVPQHAESISSECGI